MGQDGLWQYIEPIRIDGSNHRLGHTKLELQCIERSRRFEATTEGDGRKG